MKSAGAQQQIGGKINEAAQFFEAIKGFLNM